MVVFLVFPKQRPRWVKTTRTTIDNLIQKTGVGVVFDGEVGVGYTIRCQFHVNELMANG